MGSAMAKRSGGEESLWTPGVSLITRLLLSYLSVLRGKYFPIWAMAGSGGDVPLATARLGW